MNPCSPVKKPTFLQLDSWYYNHRGVQLENTKSLFCLFYPLAFWLNERDDCRCNLQKILSRPGVSPLSRDFVKEKSRLETIKNRLYLLNHNEDRDEYTYLVRSIIEVIPYVDEDNLNQDPGLPLPSRLGPPRTNWNFEYRESYLGDGGGMAGL